MMELLPVPFVPETDDAKKEIVEIAQSVLPVTPIVVALVLPLTGPPRIRYP
jgi:hypothetical protein